MRLAARKEAIRLPPLLDSGASKTEAAKGESCCELHSFAVAADDACWHCLARHSRRYFSCQAPSPACRLPAPAGIRAIPCWGLRL